MLAWCCRQWNIGLVSLALSVRHSMLIYHSLLWKDLFSWLATRHCGSWVTQLITSHAWQGSSALLRLDILSHHGRCMLRGACRLWHLTTETLLTILSPFLFDALRAGYLRATRRTPGLSLWRSICKEFASILSSHMESLSACDACKIAAIFIAWASGRISRLPIAICLAISSSWIRCSIRCVQLSLVALLLQTHDLAIISNWQTFKFCSANFLDLKDGLAIFIIILTGAMVADRHHDLPF